MSGESKPVNESRSRMTPDRITDRLRNEGLLKEVHGDLPRPITGVRNDSREVQAGNLFVARRGTQTDGHRFIGQAIESGASAVVCEQIPSGHNPADTSTCFLLVHDSRMAEGVAADEFFDRPSANLKVVAVTGTNGKTTTSTITRDLLEQLVGPSGLIGTVHHTYGDRVVSSGVTTPSASRLHALLDRMRKAGCKAVAIEASSHALDQERLAGVRLDAAVFTGLSRDHLDYHETMEAYADAKAKLFEAVPTEGVAVVNNDSEWASRMLRNCSGRPLSFGMNEGNLQGTILRASLTGTDWELSGNDENGEEKVSWPLLGTHNVLNGLAAAAAVRALTGRSYGDIASVLSDVTPVNGRLDPVDPDSPVQVLVDYAHTPDAIRNVLDALTPITPGKIHAVFGAGGERDRGKRPEMGRAADRRADRLYVTSDNPRGEDPEAIIEEILEGIDRRNDTRVEPDREQAICEAILAATPGDVVVILGKGHETVQEVDGEKRPFRDRDVAKKHLSLRMENPEP